MIKMKKENVLVLAIIMISIAGAAVYFKMKPVQQVDAKASQPVSGQVESESVQKETADPVSREKKSAGLVVAKAGSQIAWHGYQKGLELARQENKPVFLYFHADWCTYCKKLKNETFADKNVAAYLNDNFISITIDTEKERSLAAEWQVKGLPTLWFLRADNSKISNIPGYIGPDQFLNVLKYIRTESYEKMSFSDFLKTI